MTLCERAEPCDAMPIDRFGTDVNERVHVRDRAQIIRLWVVCAPEFRARHLSKPDSEARHAGGDCTRRLLVAGHHRDRRDPPFGSSVIRRFAAVGSALLRLVRRDDSPGVIRSWRRHTLVDCCSIPRSRARFAPLRPTSTRSRTFLRGTPVGNASCQAGRLVAWQQSPVIGLWGRPRDTQSLCATRPLQEVLEVYVAYRWALPHY